MTEISLCFGGASTAGLAAGGVGAEDAARADKPDGVQLGGEFLSQRLGCLPIVDFLLDRMGVAEKAGLPADR